MRSVRQKDPTLKEAVEELASGHIREAMGNLDRQGRIHEIEDADKRLEEIARQNVTSSGQTLVVSPDNQSRMELNQRVHSALQEAGKVGQKRTPGLRVDTTTGIDERRPAVGRAIRTR